jgi:hypothetical protein
VGLPVKPRRRARLQARALKLAPAVRHIGLRIDPSTSLCGAPVSAPSPDAVECDLCRLLADAVEVGWQSVSSDTAA